MKTILTSLMLVTAPLFAGTAVSSKSPVVPPPPAADPCLFTWFAGGSVGYLTELEEAMYHLQFGTDTCWSIGGWGIALFGEVGYARKSESFSFTRRNSVDFPPVQVVPVMPEPDRLRLESTSLDGPFSFFAQQSYGGYASYRLNIVPITANIKFERAFTDQFGVYFGAGLGAANVDFKANVGRDRFSDDDWVFAAQVFAGVSYYLTQSVEIFGGARWLYYENASFSDQGARIDMKMDNDYLFELGLRYKF